MAVAQPATADPYAVGQWFDDSLGVIDARSLELVDTIPTGSGTRAYGAFVAPR